MVVYVPWLGPRRFHLSLLQIVPFTRFWVTPALRYYFVYSRSTDINNRHGNPRGNGGHHVHVRTRIAKRSLRSLRNLHLIHGFDCCGSHLHTNSHCETDRPRRRFHLCCRRLLPHVLHHNLPPSHARHGLARLGPCHRHSEDVHLLLVCSLVVLRSAWLHQAVHSDAVLKNLAPARLSQAMLHHDRSYDHLDSLGCSELSNHVHTCVQVLENRRFLPRPALLAAT